MNILKLIYLSLVLTSSSLFSQQKVIQIQKDFNKVIISPHIEVVLKQGTEPKIEVESINVSPEKLKYEIVNKILQVYLEGAKTVTKNKKVVYNGHKRKIPLYKNTVAKVILTYKDVAVFSLRGEEKINFNSQIQQDKCVLRIYGKSHVTINSVKVKKLKTTLFGNGYLELNQGNVSDHKVTAYGESKVMATNLKTNQTRITAYGEGVFQVYANNRLKVNSYGEATVMYKGTPQVNKGIVIGKSTIQKL
ncbi:head GIN domain-containing protein [Tenacibaculum sp. 190524A02b]|uniref:head GIN domain-containing protein n=1 Tax=Tenacibaculum vairaonense TaxID=3137860 RepID=UPI0031FB16B5